MLKRKYSDSSPKSGYASHPDSQKTHAHVDQVKWLKESANVINNLLAGIPTSGTSTPIEESKSSSLQNFEEAYYFLARERQRIAEELGQGEKKGRTHEYGRLRMEEGQSYEGFFEADTEQPWLGMKNQIYTLTNRLIADIEKKQGGDLVLDKYSYEDKKAYYTCRKTLEKNERGNYVNYTMHVLSPHPTQKVDGQNHSTYLSTIMKIEYLDPANFKSNNIQMIYTPINKYNIRGDFNLANRYYQELINLKVENDEDKMKIFLIKAGRLAHLLAHLLPVCLGNAGITEWMIRGLAHHNGIRLGPFNYEEGISWDFKAILTPHREEYAQWYFEKAFLNNQLLTKEEAQEKFSFKKEPEKTPSHSEYSFFVSKDKEAVDQNQAGEKDKSNLNSTKNL